MTTPPTVEVHARRWFQKTHGNTYHSVRVVVDGETIGVRSYVYGYGRHYMHTAGEILRDANHELWNATPEDDRNPYDWSRPFTYASGHRVRGINLDSIGYWGKVDGVRWVLIETVEDVDRKRDLLPSWWLSVEASRE